jgi:hypothetical protein
MARKVSFFSLHGYCDFLSTGVREAVFCHFQIIQHLADITSELSHFLSNAASACGFDERNGETSQSGDVLRPISGSYPAAVLVEVPVDDVMATVFDAPVPPVDGRDALRIGLFGSLAGYSVGRTNDIPPR